MFLPSSVWVRHNFYVSGFYSTGITIQMSSICGPKFSSSVSLQGALGAFGSLMLEGFSRNSCNAREDVDPKCSHRRGRLAWVVKMPWSVCGFPVRSTKGPINFLVYVGVFIPGVCIPGTFCLLCWVTMGTRNWFPLPSRCSLSCPELGPWQSQMREDLWVSCLTLCKNN